MNWDSIDSGLGDLVFDNEKLYEMFSKWEKTKVSEKKSHLHPLQISSEDSNAKYVEFFKSLPMQEQKRLFPLAVKSEVARLVGHRIRIFKQPIEETREEMKIIFKDLQEYQSLIEETIAKLYKESASKTQGRTDETGLNL